MLDFSCNVTNLFQHKFFGTFLGRSLVEIWQQFNHEYNTRTSKLRGGRITWPRSHIWSCQSCKPPGQRCHKSRIARSRGQPLDRCILPPVFVFVTVFQITVYLYFTDAKSQPVSWLLVRGEPHTQASQCSCQRRRGPWHCEPSCRVGPNQPQDLGHFPSPRRTRSPPCPLWAACAHRWQHCGSVSHGRGSSSRPQSSGPTAEQSIWKCWRWIFTFADLSQEPEIMRFSWILMHRTWDRGDSTNLRTKNINMPDNTLYLFLYSI